MPEHPPKTGLGDLGHTHFPPAPAPMPDLPASRSRPLDLR
jgi:hypothetical protein